MEEETPEIVDEDPLAELRDALYLLSQPALEQIRLNGPGCFSCETMGCFERGLEALHETGYPGPSDTQRAEQEKLIKLIDAVTNQMQDADHEYSEEGLDRPVWRYLRDIASRALLAFGWEHTVMDGYTGEQDPTTGLFTLRRFPSRVLKPAAIAGKALRSLPPASDKVN